MEIILELLIDFLGQILFEFIAEAGFRGVGRALSNVVVRVALGAVVAVSAGFGAGLWWGARLTQTGRTEEPRTLWVSIALAVAFVALALWAIRRDRMHGDGGTSLGRQATVPSLMPWQWSPLRLLGFALLNASVATGIAVGFSPKPLG